MRLCLNMIVRNEAPVIQRCLASLRPHIAHWVIVDTGSTDATPDLVHAALAGIPGTLHHHPWIDFAHNRNQALALAAGLGDFLLIIDADDVLEADSPLPPLTADAYLLREIDSATGTEFSRLHLVRAGLPWRWEGVQHDFLTCGDLDTAIPATLLEPWRIRRNHDGARRRDPSTYRRDAAHIAATLATETRPMMVARYWFYLAQSWRDAHEPELALDAYLTRARLGHWPEEVFVSLASAAALREQLAHPTADILATWDEAIHAGPHRAEAFHGAARTCRLAGLWTRGCTYANQGLALPRPTEALFLQPWIYAWGLLDEFAVCAFHAGAYTPCLEACLHILAQPDLPPPDRTRIATNAMRALGRVGEGK